MSIIINISFMYTINCSLYPYSHLCASFAEKNTWYIRKYYFKKWNVTCPINASTIHLPQSTVYVCNIQLSDFITFFTPLSSPPSIPWNTGLSSPKTSRMMSVNSPSWALGPPPVLGYFLLWTSFFTTLIKSFHFFLIWNQKWSCVFLYWRILYMVKTFGYFCCNYCKKHKSKLT